MKKSGIIAIVLGLLIIGAVIYFTRSKPVPQTQQTQTQNQTNQPIEIVVNYQSTQAFEPKTYQVTEGQQVKLKVTSDLADELHFHGYDLQRDLEPAVQSEIDFLADKTGRFEFELEDHKTTLGVIEVQPK